MKTLKKLLKSTIVLAVLLSMLASAVLVSAKESEDYTFTSNSGSVSVSESAYTYTDYYGTETTVDLYTITLPAGTESVELTFSDNVLCYYYNGTGTSDSYIDYYVVDDYTVGSTTYSLKVDADSDGAADYIHVQTPYVGWDSTLLYAITFVVESGTEGYSFTASLDNKALTDIAVSESAYTYTDYYGTATAVDLYTITLPAGTESVELTFSDNVLCYYYDGTGTSDSYIDYYVVDDYTVGSTTYSLKVDADSDGAADYIHVQTPYVGWDSTLLYAITFDVELEADTEEPSDTVETSLDDIYKAVGNTLSEMLSSASSVSYTYDWATLGLARAGRDISDDYIQLLISYINESEGVLHYNAYSYTEYARVILALNAAGLDASSAADYNILEGLSDVESLSNQGLNAVAYALIALDSLEYDSDIRDELISLLLAGQLLDGGWTYYGSTSDVDMTAIVLQALAPYYLAGDKDVVSAVDTALEYLASQQLADGSFSYSGTTGSCETTAQVIVALTALNIDPAAYKSSEGNSVIDSIKQFYKDGQFASTASGTVNDMATYQGYYALVSYYRYVNSQTRLYDMTDLLASDEDSDEDKSANEETTDDESSNDEDAADESADETTEDDAAEETTEDDAAEETATTVSSASTGDASDAAAWLAVIAAAACVMLTARKRSNK